MSNRKTSQRMVDEAAWKPWTLGGVVPVLALLLASSGGVWAETPEDLRKPGAALPVPAGLIEDTSEDADLNEEAVDLGSGQDDRFSKGFGGLVPVESVPSFLLKNVKIISEFSDGLFTESVQCSGAMVESQFFITAAQCLYRPEGQGYAITGLATKVEVIPGYQGVNIGSPCATPGECPVGIAQVPDPEEDIFTWRRWRKHADLDWAIAVGRIDRAVGAKTSWYNYEVFKCRDFKSDRNTFQHAGYPAEPPPFDGTRMHTDRGRYDRCVINRLYYESPFFANDAGSVSAEGLFLGEMYAVLTGTRGREIIDTKITKGMRNDIADFISNHTPTVPDLSPLCVEIENLVVEAGKPLDGISFSVHNGSSASWSGTLHYDICFSADDVMDDGDTCTPDYSPALSLGPKETVEVVIANGPIVPDTLPPGPIHIGVRLTQAGGDGDPSNNATAGFDSPTITIASQYDLTVTDVAQPVNPLVGSGQPFTIEATVRNIGEGPSDPNAELLYMRSDDRLIEPADVVLGSSGALGALPPEGGATRSAAVPAPFGPGTWWVGACVGSAPDDVDPTNQCSPTARQITVAPDLRVPSLLLSSTALTCGDNLAIQATAFNGGTFPSDPTLLRYYRWESDTPVVDGEIEPADGVPQLGPGASSTEQTAVTATWPGTFWIGACVDEVAHEFDTGNQCAVPQEILVTGPELSVPTLTLRQTAFEAGETLTVTATVANTGNAVSSATTLRYFLSSDGEVTDADTPLGTEFVDGLTPASISPRNFVSAAPLAAGDWWIGACVDPSIDECDATNQCSAGVRITVGEPAPYPLTEVGKQTANLGFSDRPGPAAGDLFGHSAAISGDAAVVGAYKRDASAFGEGTADVPDGSAGPTIGDSGAAFVLERDADGAWRQVAELAAEDAFSGDWFGKSVGISGDTVAIGASAKDDVFFSSGSVYIFERQEDEDAAVWGQVDLLQSGDAASQDYFGDQLAISGDVLIVGAPGDDDGGSSSGSAYVFERLGEEWIEAAKLVAPDAAQADQFGKAVAVSGDTAVVGAYSSDGSGSSSGSAYVFQRDAGGGWVHVRTLTASGDDAASGDQFGISVAIDGDTIVVGASGDDEASWYGRDEGAVYVFERDADGSDAWGQVAKLRPADAVQPTFLGASVAIAGDTVVAGAYNKADWLGHFGAVYVFERDAGGNWSELLRLEASDEAVGDHFGAGVAVADVALVGAPRTDDVGSSSDSGSIYLFAPCEDGDGDAVCD